MRELDVAESPASNMGEPLQHSSILAHQSVYYYASGIKGAGVNTVLLREVTQFADSLHLGLRDVSPLIAIADGSNLGPDARRATKEAGWALLVANEFGAISGYRLDGNVELAEGLAKLTIRQYPLVSLDSLRMLPEPVMDGLDLIVCRSAYAPASTIAAVVAEPEPMISDSDHRGVEFPLVDAWKGVVVPVKVDKHRDEGRPLVPIVEGVIAAEAVSEGGGIR